MHSALCKVTRAGSSAEKHKANMRMVSQTGPHPPSCRTLSAGITRSKKVAPLPKGGFALDTKIYKNLITNVAPQRKKCFCQAPFPPKSKPSTCSIVTEKKMVAKCQLGS